MLADAILSETARRLSTPWQDTLRCCQNRARLVRALYHRLDQLAETAAAPSPAPVS
ncbi:hypothetical protein [Streptomyces sp. S186]|uniref:hypothetical protein n=1 Tax=Streptomyces sp. S186 TaxID=3434395 RepID=UPI003F671CCF